MVTKETLIEHAKAKDRLRFKESLPKDSKVAAQLVVSAVEGCKELRNGVRLAKWLRDEFSILRCERSKRYE
jgi:hypothetical protein